MLQREEAADVLQEACLAMWRKIGTLESEQAFRRWAYSYVRLTALNYRRKQQASPLRFTDQMPPILTDGSKVGPGEVRLESGVASFRFDSGAIVSLEGPASLAIETSMKARLIDGKALVEVPEPRAQGFVLELPHGQAVDLGTRFSAIVAHEEATCEVLEGRVLMRHTASGREEQLGDGQVVAMNDKGFEPVGYRPSMRFAPKNRGLLVLRSGKEATVVSLKWLGKDLFHEREQYVDDRMLLVKMEHESRAQRRALFNIDLRGVRPSKVEAATLNLNLVPSGLGFVAYLPETVTFAVYGITDEARETGPPPSPDGRRRRAACPEIRPQ